jgi:hypothetical protein
MGRGARPLVVELACVLSALSFVGTLLSCTDAPSAPVARVPGAGSADAQRPDASAPDASSAPSKGPVDGGRAALDAGTPSATDAATAARASLIIHDLWRSVASADDPFDDRPEQAKCELSGTMTELLADERVFSVDTGVCNYLTVRQSTLFEIAAGEKINVRLWHFALTAPEPAEAHAAVLVDGLHVLDERVAIPGAGGLLTRTLRVERTIPSGAPVHFHLHNHGGNSWSLVEVSVGE